MRFGKIINGMFLWIDNYRSMNKTFDYIDVALLIFIERVLSECLSDLNWDNSSIVLKSKLYQVIK